MFQFSYEIPSCLTGKNAANCCQYGLSLLTLEPDDDIVKELEDKSEVRKGLFHTETTPLHGRICQNVCEKCMAQDHRCKQSNSNGVITALI